MIIPVQGRHFVGKEMTIIKKKKKMEGVPGLNPAHAPAFRSPFCTDRLIHELTFIMSENKVTLLGLCPSPSLCLFLSVSVQCTLGWPKMHMRIFTWNIPWPGARGRRVRKYIRFFILFIPRSSNCKNLFADFRKFISQHFLLIYIIFHILTQPRNSRFIFNKFQRHSLIFMRSIAT